MRRLSAKYAVPGMVLGNSVYNNYGTKLLHQETKLDLNCIKILRDNMITEILIQDWRVEDVPVAPLISPELEGRAARALRKLIIDGAKTRSISAQNILEAGTAANTMAQELALASVGEVTVAAIASEADYMFIQPVKTAVLGMVIGQALGYDTALLSSLGTAALLKDVGNIMLPQDIVQNRGTMTNEQMLKLQQHTGHGYNLLKQHSHCTGVISTAVFQHHEQWNGKGYPSGLKGADISSFAQIITIADKYTAILSRRPGSKKIYMPHEAIEFIMAYGGEYFNPRLVELFVRRVGCYSSGLAVRLNTGEVGIVVDPKLGFIARPIVRICLDDKGEALDSPYDIDLSKVEFQRMLISEILDYD